MQTLAFWKEVWAWIEAADMTHQYHPELYQNSEQELAVVSGNVHWHLTA